MKSFIADVLKDIAEGKWGAKPKAAYWWLHSHALWIGGTFAAAHFALTWAATNGLCSSCASYDHTLVLIAEWLMGTGLALGFHAADAPAAPSK